ncbi:putative necrosis-inducing factor-domain-containing protein [Aspergillus pseudoustus]|uniref:Necrosis-inducing factor-domain-containing protein n=1 Tax=Aspergillus pseudoustus TaxID=1810923 RepID=A0ABR4K804_9EURO
MDPSPSGPGPGPPSAVWLQCREGNCANRTERCPLGSNAKTKGSGLAHSCLPSRTAESVGVPQMSPADVPTAFFIFSFRNSPDSLRAVSQWGSLNLYTAWGLGGTSDWATDLQEYHPVPRPATSWAALNRLIMIGQNPKKDPTRNGNWTDFNCKHDVIDHKLQYTPSKRIWKETDKKNHNTFVESLSDTLGVGDHAHCGGKISDSCVAVGCESVFNDDTSGPVAQFIWNSIVELHMLYKDYDDGLTEAMAYLSLQMDDLQVKFAPFPGGDDDLWKELLTDLLVLGGLGTDGPFFKKILTSKAWFQQESTLENTQSTVMTLLDQAYMGQVILGWKDFTIYAMSELLTTGSDEALDALWDLISDGKLIEGKFENKVPPPGNPSVELRHDILKCVFGFTIPALWRAAGTYSFIISTGTRCDEGKADPDYYLEEMEQYLDADTMKTAGACVLGYQWYLVYPEGESKECHCQPNDGGPCNELCKPRKFSAPPGLNTLNGTNMGTISKEELIKGSIRTWAANGGENSDKYPDPTHAETVNNLMDVDVTTPGFMQIPICSPGRAYESWDKSKPGSRTFYPCHIPPGIGYCGQSSFTDQTSDASPKIEHCRTIIKNIQGDPTTDFTHQVVGKPHREILHPESCHFGIEAAAVNGNVEFKVGGQDVIDIINDAISQYGRGGLIGAKGFMNCNGNVKTQAVEWGIY